MLSPAPQSKALEVFRLIFQFAHGSGRRWSSNVATEVVAEEFRALMRKVPQPVALVLTHLSHPPDSSSTALPHPDIHGATLSSFTSISLHPSPIVSFALRVPSRLATALQQGLQATSEKSARSGDTAVRNRTRRKRFSVSLLSVEDQPIAKAFSKPLADHATLLYDRSLWMYPRVKGSSPEALEGDREARGGGGDDLPLPIVRNSLGGAICEVITSIPLWNLDADVTTGKDGSLNSLGEGERAKMEMAEGGSVLFIARVLEVVGDDSEQFGKTIADGEVDAGGQQDRPEKEPLLHVNRLYMGLKGEIVG